MAEDNRKRAPSSKQPSSEDSSPAKKKKMFQATKDMAAEAPLLERKEAPKNMPSGKSDANDSSPKQHAMEQTTSKASSGKGSSATNAKVERFVGPTDLEQSSHNLATNNMSDDEEESGRSLSSMSFSSDMSFSGGGPSDELKKHGSVRSSLTSSTSISRSDGSASCHRGESEGVSPTDGNKNSGNFHGKFSRCNSVSNCVKGEPLYKFEDGTDAITNTNTLIRENTNSKIYKGIRRHKQGVAQDVAIKICLRQRDWWDLQHEFKILRLLKHPNVIEVFDFYQIPVPAYVMRHVAGWNLYDYLRCRIGFVLNHAKEVLKGVGAGLKHLHDKHIVHRDLKPDNILLEEMGGGRLRPLLIDFGSAIMTYGTGRAVTTSEEEAVGSTPPWEAPELMKDVPEWSTKSDMFSLGVIIWGMLTGNEPFEGVLSDAREWIRGGGRPDLDALPQCIPQDQVGLMVALWDADPEIRPSVDEFLERLDREGVGAEDDASLVFGNNTRTTELLHDTDQSKVYLGIFHQNETAEAVTIKVFHDWDGWHDELQNVLRLPPHPSVMGILEYHQVPRPAFVMKYINGGNLRKHLDERGPFVGADAREILVGIGQGLRHLHRYGVVHRDLKSQNVLLERLSDTRYLPVLSNFGLCQIAPGDPLSDGTAPGDGNTSPWMAPETRFDNIWSCSTDMYSLGIIMWEILTGQMPPLQEPATRNQMAPHIVGDTMLDVVRASEGQKSLMRRLWSQDPKRRPSVDEFLQEMQGQNDASSSNGDGDGGGDGAPPSASNSGKDGTPPPGDNASGDGQDIDVGGGNNKHKDITMPHARVDAKQDKTPMNKAVVCNSEPGNHHSEQGHKEKAPRQQEMQELSSTFEKTSFFDQDMMKESSSSPRPIDQQENDEEEIGHYDFLDESMREAYDAQREPFSYWHDVRENEEKEEDIYPQQSDLASFSDVAATLPGTNEATTTARSTQEEDNTSTSASSFVLVEPITRANHAPSALPRAAAAARKMGPSQRHYEQAGENKRQQEQLLMCIVIGLCDPNGRLVDGTDFRHEPYTTYYQWLRAKGEKRKDYEPTGFALEKEIDRRFRLLPSNSNEKRPARGRCKDNTIQWLVDHPITNPSDIAFFTNEISDYRRFVQASTSSPTAAATDESIEAMERRLNQLELDLVVTSLARRWCREQVVSKAKELERCSDDEKLLSELKLVQYAKTLEAHINTERRLLDEKSQLQKKLSPPSSDTRVGGENEMQDEYPFYPGGGNDASF